MREGVRLGLDLGNRRIGVARSDRAGLLAIPVSTLDATGDWLQDVRNLITEQPILEIVVGLPISLSGKEELAANRIREQVATLKADLPGIPIRLVDERLTSAGALQHLRNAGHSSKSARVVIDSAAATELLEFALEFERRTGEPAGEQV